MVYEMAKRLKESGRLALLLKMEQAAPKELAKYGNFHHVFEQSFDCKPCYTEKFMEQKLDYIRHHPCTKKWNLVNEFTDYKHSSAGFYELNLPGVYVVDVTEMEWQVTITAFKVP